MTYKYIRHLIDCETGEYIRSTECTFVCNTINSLIETVEQYLKCDMDCDFGGWSILKDVNGVWEDVNYKRLDQIYSSKYWTEKRRLRAQQEYEAAMKQLEEFEKRIRG